MDCSEFEGEEYVLEDEVQFVDPFNSKVRKSAQ